MILQHKYISSQDNNPYCFWTSTIKCKQEESRSELFLWRCTSFDLKQWGHKELFLVSLKLLHGIDRRTVALSYKHAPSKQMSLCNPTHSLLGKTETQLAGWLSHNHPPDGPAQPTNTLLGFNLILFEGIWTSLLHWKQKVGNTENLQDKPGTEHKYPVFLFWMTLSSFMHPGW